MTSISPKTELSAPTATIFSSGPENVPSDSLYVTLPPCTQPLGRAAIVLAPLISFVRATGSPPRSLGEPRPRERAPVGGDPHRERLGVGVERTALAYLAERVEGEEAAVGVDQVVHQVTGAFVGCSCQKLRMPKARPPVGEPT